jgi:N6-adenosine-specific RNA methylase IME4
MNELIRIPTGMTATAVSLSLPEPLSLDDWRAIGRELRRAESGITWWLGDWLRFGAARRWGEKYAEAVKLGFAYQTAVNAENVANKFADFNRRRLNLTWSDHAAVAALDPALADALLDQAVANRWPVQELRRHARRGYLQISGPDGGSCGFEELHRLVAEGVRFGCIYADPPWLYDNQGTRAATSNHYDGMTVDELCDPNLMPIAALAAKDAHLHLWTVNAFLFECPKIFDAWGFDFKSTFVWTKREIGIGNYWRNSHEILLTAVRGDAKHFDDHSLRSWLECARGRHSDKPDQVRDMIAKASPTPRIELFARAEHDGWLSWGDQIEKNLFSKRVAELMVA